MIGGFLYPPTWLHKIPAGPKLLLLLVIATVLMMQGTWWLFALALSGVLGLYASLGGRAIRRLQTLRPLLPILLIIYLLQWYVAGHAMAAASIGRLLTMVLLADLVTMTTPMQAMLDAIAPVLKPLERFGLNSARIALAIALVIRFVPVLFDVWSGRRDAWRARTARPLRPMLIRLFLHDTLRMSDHVAEALDARGFGNIAPRERR